MNPFILLGVGIFCGLLNGYLGVGAAIVLIPVLTYALGFDQKVAQSASLTVMIPMALAGMLTYRLRYHVAPPLEAMAILAGAAVAGSVLGSVLANMSSSRHLKLVFAAFVVVSGVALMIQALRETES